MSVNNSPTKPEKPGIPSEAKNAMPVTKVKAGMGDVMKNPVDRFFTVEHAGMMILAWILVHVGRSSVKRAPNDAAKHKKMLIFFGLAFLIIIASIPWPFRAEIARPWLRMFN